MIMHLPVHVVHTVMEESFIFSYYFDSSHKQFLYCISILCDYCHRNFKKTTETWLSLSQKHLKPFTFTSVTRVQFRSRGKLIPWS